MPTITRKLSESPLRIANPSPKSTLHLLSRPHTPTSTLNLSITPLELTILGLGLAVFFLMLVWIFFVILELTVRYLRGHLFKGDSTNGYTEIEGRRYAQDMLVGGDHLEHRQARREIVEKLALLGNTGGPFAAGSRLFGKREIAIPMDEEAMSTGRVSSIGSVECDGDCPPPVKLRKNSR